jgi:hypothetical protein
MSTILNTGGILLVAGLDVSKPEEYVGEQYATDVQNFYVDRGLLTKRIGTTSRGVAIGGTDKEIMAGREFEREGVRYNVRIGRDHIENYNSGTDTWDDITGTTLTGDSSDLIDTAVPLLSGDEILCVTNGVDNIRKWTASGNCSDLGGSPPKAKFIQEYKSYLVCANITGGVDVSQRVQWSDTADPETWSGGNSGAVDLVEDGKPITGLNIFGTFLCVHKQTCIYIGTLVSSSAIFRFDRRVTQAGTVANGSIVNLPSGEQIFLAEDGLRIFNGVTAPLIPSPINDEIRDDLNKEYAFKSWGVLVLEEDEVWIGIPMGSQTVGETVYKYNYKTGALYKDTRASINAVWRATQSSALTWDDFGDEVTWDSLASTVRWNDGQLGSISGLLHFGDTSGVTTIQRIGYTADNGTAIDAYWDSKDFKAETLGQLLRFQEIWVWARGSGALKVYYSTDEGETWTSAGTITLTVDFPNQATPQRLFIDTVAQQARVRFQHDGETGTVQIKQFFMGYTEREYMA